MILTCNSYSYILEASKDLALIFVDLDGVVMKAPSYGFGAEGFKQFHSDNQGKLSVADIMHWAYICNNNTDYVPLSPTLNDYLSSAAESKTVLGLTARIPEFSLETLAQLKSVGMKFSQSVTCSCVCEAFIKNGIIFVGHDPNTGLSNDKGKIIKDMADAGCLGIIENIGFIDDSRGNLEKVELALKATPYAFVGIHFTQDREALTKYSSDTLRSI